VPLQDIDLAIARTRIRGATLGFAGVEVGSNINGVPIGAPALRPVLRSLRGAGRRVFVHAIRPAGMDRLVGPPPLQQVLGYPGDVGLAAASVITSNLLVRRPGLRIAFSHGGGTLASLLPRLQQGWGVFPALKDAVHAAPVEQARRCSTTRWCSMRPRCATWSPTFGASQLLIGTDYPFNFHDRTPVERIEAAGFDADVTRAAGAPQRRALPRPPNDKEDPMSSPWIEGPAQRRPQRARPRQGRSLLHADLAPGSRAPRRRRRSTCAAAAATTTCWRCTGGPCRRSATSPCARAARAGAAMRWRRAPRPPAARMLAGRRTARDPAGGVGRAARPARPHPSRSCTATSAAPKSAHHREGPPERLTHVVLNSHAVDETQRFLEEALGFTLADRTVDHRLHELQQRPPHASRSASGRQRRAEPHRLRDAGLRVGDARRRPHARRRLPIQWGPGRHGPGNNLFNYFIDPFGVVIEYTAEVSRSTTATSPRPVRLEVAARPRRPVGHLEAAVGPA
jgi:catechol 2,3-dioxygenase-like lactoylglutathione lyase family enzyme